jgi:hypothetical protein
MSKSGFSFEGRGKVDRVETFTTKNGKEIITLIIQVEGTYPQLVPVKFFGRVAVEAKDFGEGDVVEITGRLGGREWNGKVYPDVIGESIDAVATGRGAKRGDEQAAQPVADDLDPPF